jgi:hypothetical protein
MSDEKSLFDKVKDIAGDAFEKGKGVAGEAFGKAKDVAGDVKGKVSEKFDKGKTDTPGPETKDDPS